MQVLSILKHKQKPMSEINPFQDQARFMQASGQTVGQLNAQQYQLYCNLIHEEFEELVASDNMNDDLDALIDILVVTIGAIHSLGADAQGAWQEVMRSNLAKIDPNTGLVHRREDGKILKPDGWTPPKLEPFLPRPPQ